jgi:hypothetical protein
MTNGEIVNGKFGFKLLEYAMESIAIDNINWELIFIEYFASLKYPGSPGAMKASPFPKIPLKSALEV